MCCGLVARYLFGECGYIWCIYYRRIFITDVLDHFSGGIEHGHVHLTTSEDNKKGAFPIGMLGGLCIHAFLEGFPLGSVDEHTLEYLIWGIVVHNIPVSIVLVGFLKHQKISNIGIIASITLFACMTPLGAYLTQYLNASFPVLVSYQPIALALVIGILMHLATTIFFESIKHHKIQISKFVISLMGVLVALIIHSQHTH